jgi:hypothetical protein
MAIDQQLIAIKNWLNSKNTAQHLITNTFTRIFIEFFWGHIGYWLCEKKSKFEANFAEYVYVISLTFTCTWMSIISL